MYVCIYMCVYIYIYIYIYIFCCYVAALGREDAEAPAVPLRVPARSDNDTNNTSNPNNST